MSPRWHDDCIKSDRGKERASERPSLVVKLSLPTPIPREPIRLPPCREVQARNMKATQKPNPSFKKRYSGSLTDSEEDLGKFPAILTRAPTLAAPGPQLPQPRLHRVQAHRLLLEALPIRLPCWHRGDQGQLEVWAEGRDRN